VLLEYLGSKSFRNSLADAAIEVIRRLDDSFFIEPLRRTLSENERDFTSWGFARALDTLAHISRNEDNKTKIRTFLTGYVNHPKRNVQSGAIRALGTLGDSKAIGVLETFSGDDPSNRIQRSARDALRKLRETKQLVPDEIIRLRETIDKLSKETEKLHNDLEDIKNRLDAKEQAAKAKGGNETSE